VTPARTFYAPHSGRIECAVRAQTDEQLARITAAHVLIGLAWLDADSDPDLHVVVNGAVAGRPLLPVPEAYTIAPGAEWEIDGIPDGTTVTDEPGGFLGTVTGGLVREWTEPGVYRMRLDPPFPHRPAECVVTVAA
jgi:hypothetical protein